MRTTSPATTTTTSTTSGDAQTPNISHANSIGRRVAFLNNVESRNYIDRDANRTRRHYPRRRVQENLPPIVLYTPQNVLLDSGASDHMHSDIDALTHLEEFITEVILPDGNLAESFYRGTLRMGCVCKESLEEFNVPLLDTLHVTGLRLTLWSVPAFCRQGHAIFFH